MGKDRSDRSQAAFLLRSCFPIKTCAANGLLEKTVRRSFGTVGIVRKSGVRTPCRGTFRDDRAVCRPRRTLYAGTKIVRWDYKIVRIAAGSFADRSHLGAKDGRGERTEATCAPVILHGQHVAPSGRSIGPRRSQAPGMLVGQSCPPFDLRGLDPRGTDRGGITICGGRPHTPAGGSRCSTEGEAPDSSPQPGSDLSVVFRDVSFRPYVCCDHTSVSANDARNKRAQAKILADVAFAEGFRSEHLAACRGLLANDVCCDSSSNVALLFCALRGPSQPNPASRTVSE